MPAKPPPAIRYDGQHGHEFKREHEPNDPVGDGSKSPPRVASPGLFDRDHRNDEQRRDQDRNLEAVVPALGPIVHTHLVRRDCRRALQGEGEANENQDEDRDDEPESGCASNVKARMPPPLASPSEEREEARDDGKSREPDAPVHVTSLLALKEISSPPGESQNAGRAIQIRTFGC